jgi:ligand-binding SRPBCC domain-containing protein
MDEDVALRFESRLRAPRECVWEWITSVKGISAEMWPYFRMTAPRHVRSLADVEFKPGARLFRSYVFLFGFLPIDYSDMTLLELDAGQGFVEQSPMGSMTLWRHERHILPCPDEPGAVLLVDQLRFRPRMARRLVRWFIGRVFVHRHAVLRARLGGT